jgi:hypothetical protein
MFACNASVVTCYKLLDVRYVVLQEMGLSTALDFGLGRTSRVVASSLSIEDHVSIQQIATAEQCQRDTSIPFYTVALCTAFKVSTL